MNNLRRYFKVIVGVAALAAVAFGLFIWNGARTRPSVENAVVVEPQTPRAEGEFESDRDARDRWFWGPRLYGSGDLPAEARRVAKEVSDKIAPELPADQLGGAVWTAMGPQPTFSTAYLGAFGDSSGRINSIAVQPGTPATLLVGSATGGIWRSTNALDANPVFVPVSDGQVDLAVGSIDFSRSTPTTAYAGMGDQDNGYLGTGILKSTDSGATWARVDVAGLPARGTASNVAVSINNANTVFAARTEYFRGRGPQVVGGFYRSVDGGANWTRTFGGSVSSVALHPTNPNVVYISVLNTFFEMVPPARGVYMSIDGGATFNPINGAIDFSGISQLQVATTAANPNKLYAYGGTTTAPFIWATVNDGVNPIVWTANALTLAQFDAGQFDYNNYMAANPYVDGQLYVGSRDVFRITLNPATNALMSVVDITNSWVFNGVAWDYTLFGSKVHSDQQSFAFGANTNTFYAGSDGGINRTTDGGATFTKNLNNTLGLTQAIGVTIHPVSPLIAYTGTQDNGTQRREAGNQWREFSNGDGGYAVVNPLDGTMVFTSYVNGSFTRHGGHGTIFQANVNAGFPGMRINFYCPFVGNGTDATLYTGTQTLAVCTNCATSPGAGTWTFPAGPASDLTRDPTDILSAVAVQKSAFNATQVIYVGSNQGAFRVSQNGGAAFTDRTATLDAAVGQPRAISNIRIDPANAGTAYITLSGFGTQHVFRSTNFGATIVALPFAVDIPVNDFLIHPTTPTTFFLATDIGVYRSTDSGATWNQFNTGMPPVVVNRFDSAPDGRIAAATYGRGNYSLNFVVAANVTVAGRITKPSGMGIGNVIVTLTDGQGQSRRVRTNSTGRYEFTDVAVGENYIFRADSKQWQFANNPRIITVLEEISELDFVAGK